MGHSRQKFERVSERGVLAFWKGGLENASVKHPPFWKAVCENQLKFLTAAGTGWWHMLLHAG